jgi:hypothetical protein
MTPLWFWEEIWQPIILANRAALANIRAAAEWRRNANLGRFRVLE